MPISGQQFHIPTQWHQACARIRSRGGGKILVLGATDRGKSTFCAFLTRYLLEQGQRPAYVDADVGQKDIGPPATITLGYPRRDVPLQTLQPEAMYFIGSVSPVHHLLPMIVGTRQLLERATNSAFVIINTSGLVEGVGGILKAYQIDSLRPDLIVALEKGTELSPILEAHEHFPIMRLPCSPLARAKSMEHRQRNRQMAFRRYFASATERALKLDQLIVQRLPASPHPLDWKRILTPNRLCALADERQSVLGLGILSGYEQKKRQIRLRTPAPARGRILQLGDMPVELPER